MYLDHYGLREPPFAAAPDPRFAFLTEAAESVLARLEQEVRIGSGGIVLLSAPHGAGKTLLSNILLERLPESSVRVARILNPGTEPVELMQSICSALRVPVAQGQEKSAKQLVDALSAFLMDVYAQGQRVVLIVDEAQRLGDEALEQLRLLTNLETPAHKLIHILLLASPELEERLRASNLHHLAQRIAVREHLPDFDPAGTEAYVRHRMQVAGATQLPFSRLALRALHRYSQGNPHRINRIADRALRLAAKGDVASIGERLVQQSAHDVLQSRIRYWLQRYRRHWLLVALLLVVVVAAGIWWLWRPAPAPVPGPTKQVKILRQTERLTAALPDATKARMLAWSEMLARWQVSSKETSVADASHCAAQIFPGFNCVAGTATLDQLERFDRPLILELRTTNGLREVLLLGIGVRDVRLDLGPRDVDVPRTVLEQVWTGRFYAPFRLPPWMPSRVDRGDAGRAVSWIDQCLRRLDHDQTGAHRPAIFDAVLQQRVKQLQKGFGIRADGIVGPETLFALASLRQEGPHLARDVR